MPQTLRKRESNLCQSWVYLCVYCIMEALFGVQPLQILFCPFFFFQKIYCEISEIVSQPDFWASLKLIKPFENVVKSNVSYSINHSLINKSYTHSFKCETTVSYFGLTIDIIKNIYVIFRKPWRRTRHCPLKVELISTPSGLQSKIYFHRSSRKLPIQLLK